jgi:hypothetical protein
MLYCIPLGIESPLRLDLQFSLMAACLEKKQSMKQESLNGHFWNHRKTAKLLNFGTFTLWNSFRFLFYFFTTMKIKANSKQIN